MKCSVCDADVVISEMSSLSIATHSESDADSHCFRMRVCEKCRELILGDCKLDSLAAVAHRLVLGSFQDTVAD